MIINEHEAIEVNTMPFPVTLENIDSVVDDLEIHGQELGFIGADAFENLDQKMEDFDPKQRAYYESVTGLDCSEIFNVVDGLLQQMDRFPSLEKMVSEEYCFSSESAAKKYSEEEIERWKGIYFPRLEKKDSKKLFNALRTQRENWSLSKIFEATQFRKTAKFKKVTGLLGFENGNPRQPAEDEAITKVREKIEAKEQKDRSEAEAFMLQAIDLKETTENIFNALTVLQKGMPPLGKSERNLSTTTKAELSTQYGILISKLGEIKEQIAMFKQAVVSLPLEVEVVEEEKSSSSKSTSEIIQEWCDKLSEKILRVIKKPNSNMQIAQTLSLDELNKHIEDLNQAGRGDEANIKIEAFKQNLLKGLTEGNKKLVYTLLTQYVDIYSLTLQKKVNEGDDTTVLLSKGFVRSAERKAQNDELEMHYKIKHPEIDKEAEAWAITQTQSNWDKFKTIVKDNYKQFLFYSLIAVGLVALGVFTFGIGTAAGIGATAALGTTGTAVIFGAQRVLQRKYGNNFLNRGKLAILGKTTEPVQTIDEPDFSVRDDVSAAGRSRAPTTVADRKEPASDVKHDASTSGTAFLRSPSPDPRGGVPDADQSAEEHTDEYTRGKNYNR